HPSIYRGNINRGDGTSALGSVAYDANLGQFVVSSSHTFAQAAGSTADITLQLTDTTNGDAAGMSDTVPLQAATAAAAQIAFGSATYAVNRNGSDAVITVVR